MAEDIRVLAVDDSSVIRAMMGVIFTAAGCEIVTTCGAREGLRALRNFEPHVILTDYNMPGLDGHAFVRLVRRIDRFRSLPILVVSSEDGPEKRLAMTDAGADAWFPKPIDAAQILAAVQAVARPTATVLAFPQADAPRGAMDWPRRLFARALGR